MTMQNSQNLSKIFDCQYCDSRTKNKRGCFRKKRIPVIEIDCVCENDRKCNICKGNGTFKLFVCPQTVFSDSNIRRTISFFYHYVATEFREYPNGKGLLYQPIKLLESFNLLSGLYQSFKEKEQDK